MRFVIICGVIALCCMSSAEAYTMAFAWANKPWSYTYTPSEAYSYNAGKSITITRVSKGHYDVDFGRVAVTGAHAQVTMYGTALGHCTLSAMGSGVATVECYDERMGSHADRLFNILVINACGDDSEYVSYAWLSNHFSNSYIANSAQRFGDGSFQVTKSGSGRYRVDLGSPVGQEACVLATTFRSNKFCNVDGWGSGTANLECRNLDLTYGDSRVQVLAIKAGFPHASFLWNSSPNGVINDTWSHPSDGSSQTVSRTGVGKYTVTVGPEAAPGGHIQVVSYDTDATCFVTSWGDGKASIRCSRGTNLTDSAFVVLAIA